MKKIQGDRVVLQVANYMERGVKTFVYSKADAQYVIEDIAKAGYGVNLNFFDGKTHYIYPDGRPWATLWLAPASRFSK